MTRTYAIGDSHGCLTQLQSLIEQCERHAGEGRNRFVFLGDYIDRGPDSRGVIDFLIDLQTWSPDEIVCLMGNHEASCWPQSTTRQTNRTGCEMAGMRH